MQQVHLLTCVHGMWGSPVHLERLAEVMTETYEQRRAGSKGKARADGSAAEEQNNDVDNIDFEVLIAESNRESHTYDGVDWGAERVVEEIKQRIKVIEADGTRKVTKFSIIGYSLGGLLSRYVVGILQSQGFFDSVKPQNFHTIATPHIGLLRYPTFFSQLFARLGPTFLSRTGEHFYGTDNWTEDGKSLLEVMSEPDSVFYQALTQFPNLTIYGNAISDVTVPFPTALIEAHDPFADHEKSGIKIELDPDYAPLIASYTLGANAVAPEAGPRFMSKRWFKKKRVLRLPPFLQKRFPLNLVVYALIPILLPIGVIIAVSNFTYNAFNSRRRIRTLEKSGKSNRNAIMEFVRNLERDVEGVIVDYVDAGGEELASTSGSNTPQPDARPADTSSTTMALNNLQSPTDLQAVTSSDVSNKLQPALLPAQKRMIANLNSLPHLKKKMAFIDGVTNTHATVVCRDVKRFEFHRRGEGVLRHLADEFIF